MKMKLDFAIAGLTIFSLTGCLETEYFVRDGVSFTQYQRDVVGCATQAAQAVPTNTQVGWAPYVGVYSSDTNEGLRMQNKEICLNQKGYSRATIPPCTGEAASDALAELRGPKGTSLPMHFASNTCYIVAPSNIAYYYTAKI